MRFDSGAMVAMALVVLSTGCAHVRQPVDIPDDPQILRREILAAEDLASQVSLYRASHRDACLDQARMATEQLNQAARQFFLLTNYSHPTIRSTAYILGRANARKASVAAHQCGEAFGGR
jgi:hypothetical protein